MKRWSLPVAVLLGCVGVTSADYVIIKIDLNKAFPASKMPGPMNPGENPPMGDERPGFGGYGKPGLPAPPTTTERPMPGEGEIPQYDGLSVLWGYAYIEIKGKATRMPANQFMPFERYQFDTKYGKTLWIPADLVKLISLAPVGKRFDDKVKADLKDGKTAEKLLLLAEWALEHGLLPEFGKMIDELKALDPKHPVVSAVNQVRDEMKKVPQQYDPAAKTLIDDLKKENYREFRSKQDHYTLLANVERKKDAESAVSWRLKRMEDVYESYYYWFALKGKVRPQPARRLVAVLVDTHTNTKEFDIHHVSYNNVPMLADGFTARRDNVVVFASGRLDPAYVSLAKNNQDILWGPNNVTPGELMDGSIWKRRSHDLYQRIPWLQTTTLLQHAMEDESDLATVTHECIRQLTAATDLLPRTVTTAEWAQFGIASFFETPHTAFYPGVGAPSWSHLVSFKYLRKTKRLGGATPREVLLNVVTDRYFRQAYASLQSSYQIKEEKEAFDDKTKRELELARCTSWSLMYFLAHHKLDNLVKYFDELSNLPRDLEYNEKVLQTCFIRAFGDKLDQLAAAWYTAMEQTVLEMPEVEQENMRTRMERPKTAPQPQPGTRPNPYPDGTIRPGPGLSGPPRGPGY